MKNARIAASASMRYEKTERSYVPGLPDGHMEQDIGRIMVAIDHAFENLRHRSSRYLLETRSISITGQMHGVVCWDSTKPQIRSRLVTWEDKRCDRKFLQDIKSITGYDVHSGMGIATLAWLQRHKSNEFRKYDRAGTVMDYFASIIVDLSSDKMPCMDFTNAASWGCFDIKRNEFDSRATSMLDLDHLLPNLRPSGSFLGSLCKHWASRTGVPMGTAVGVAMGDCACVVQGTLDSPEKDICVTFGTSSQIALIIPRNEGLNSSFDSQTELRPYFEADFMLVGASLNGGNVLEETARGMQRMCRGLGCTPPPDLESTYKRLDRAARSVRDKASIRVDARFNGERHLSSCRGGSIENITSQKSFDVGTLWYATCRALLENLRDMLPRHVRVMSLYLIVITRIYHTAITNFYTSRNSFEHQLYTRMLRPTARTQVLETRKRVLCVGGAFECCATLAKAAREVFDFMKVEFVESSSKFLAALGAIRVGSKALLSSSSNKHDEDRTRNQRRTEQKEEPSKNNVLMSILPSRDSIGLSPKQKFERKSEKRLEIYKKMYRKTRRCREARDAPSGVRVEEMPSTPHALLSCQIKNKPESVAPFAGVVSPLKETTTPWRRQRGLDYADIDDDKLGTSNDLYNLDRALDAALLMEKGIMNGRDPDL